MEEVVELKKEVEDLRKFGTHTVDRYHGGVGRLGSSTQANGGRGNTPRLLHVISSSPVQRR